MADLSARLPSEIDSQKRYIAPSAPAPSILEYIADFGSKTLGVAGVALDHRAQEKDAAAKAQKLSADNDVAKGWLNVAGQTVPPEVANDPNAAAAVSSAQSAAPAILKQQTAANQGVIDPGAAQARMLSMARQVYAKHPGYEAFVFSALKDAGVTDMITQHYKNAEAGLERATIAQEDRHDALAKLAVTKYGYSDFDTLDTGKKATALAYVSASEEAEHALDLQSKKMDITLKQQNLTDQQRTSLQTQLSTDLAQSTSNYLNKAFTSANLVAFNLLADPVLANDPARLEKAQSHLFSVVIPGMRQMWATKMGPVLLKMTPADREAVNGMFEKQITSFTDMISGPQSVVAANTRIMTDISNTYGIQFAQASPTLMRVQKIVGPTGMATLLDPAIQGNVVLREQLANELKGAIADPSKVVSFSELVTHLADGTDLSSFNPDQIKSMAPSSIAATAVLSKNIPATNGTNKEDHKLLVNSIKNTSGIAVDVTPSWGFKNVLTQGKVLNSSGVTRSLFFTSTNKQERDEAIRSWLPATQRTYEALKRSKANDDYYSVQMDPHTMKWGAVWNGQKVTDEGTRRIAVGAGGYEGNGSMMSVQPKPSSAVLEQASTLNAMLNNLSQAGSQKYDDTFQGKSVSYGEARRFYATGEIPAALQAPTKSKNGKTPEQNVDDAISHMLDFVNKLPTDTSAASGGGGKLPPALENKAAMDAYYAGPGKSGAANYQQNAPLVASAAEAHGVPIGVAMNVIHTESKFNPNADSGDAHGLGQISYKEAARRGWDLKHMSVTENIDKAMFMLAENYKATGNWHDAASMYLTGRTIAKAGNASDKNGTTATEYAAAVVPSSYDWSKVAAAGYKRY